MESDRKVLSEYVHRRRVQFYETDAAGIVHFSWFFRYMEEAEHALWRAAGLSIHPPDSPIGWARASATCDFKRPLRFEDEFDVTIRIAAISREDHPIFVRADERRCHAGDRIDDGDLRAHRAEWSR